MDSNRGSIHSNDLHIEQHIAEMRYLDAYRYIFRHPKWLANVLLVGTCMVAGSVIPIVPHIIIMGYQFEIIEALHRRPRDDYPEFDFNRISEYLTRGVWPFLVTLVATLVIVPLGLALAFVLGGMFISMLTAGADTIALVLLGALALVLFTALNVLMGIALLPMSLRAGLAHDFAAGFDFQFLKSFIARVGLEVVLMWLFLTGTSLALTLAGFLACIVGSLFAVAIIMLAQAHLMYQLYELYLSRGGDPIPLKSDAPR